MSRYGKCSEIDQDIVRIEERSANSQGNDQEHGSSRRCQFDPHRALDHQFLDSLIKAGGGDCIASNCISYAFAAVHFCRLLHSVFAMVTSFLATAVMMTLCGFPALRRRSAKDFRLGL